MNYETSVSTVAPTAAAISHYYSQVLQTSSDLKTNACCTSGKPPRRILDALKRVHPDVVAKYYGCGLVFPTAVEGLAVLDLGCGAGRDCYLLSQFVGKEGKVSCEKLTGLWWAVGRMKFFSRTFFLPFLLTSETMFP